MIAEWVDWIGWRIFLVSLVSGILMDLMGAYSYIYPSGRFWPIGKKRTIRGSLVNVTHFIAGVGTIICSFMNMNTFVLPGLNVFRFAVGIFFFVVGIYLDKLSISHLTWKTSSGIDGKKVVKEGVYEYSRNPQYMARNLALIGLFVFTNSTYCSILIVIFGGGLLLAPLIEEPYLKQLFGKEYEEYCKTTNRYLQYY